MKYYALIHRSLLKYEKHIIPKIKFTKYIWGVSTEIKFLIFRAELKIINRKIANELIAENGE
jgi:hypothetical protein